MPVDVWHADDDGFYNSQKPSYATQGPSSRARFITDADGRFFFRTILPCSYPIPTDGPVGEMIIQTRRHAMRPAHVHFLVAAHGYEPLITHVFMEGDKYLDSDVVFGVKDELVAKIEKRTDSVDARRQADRHAMAPDDLRIPDETRRRNRPGSARREGGGRRLKAGWRMPAQFLCAAQELSECANFGCEVPPRAENAGKRHNSL